MCPSSDSSAASQLLRAVGDAFLGAYVPIVERRRDQRVSASASASSRRCAAAATWSSTWCTTAARCSACSRAAAPNRILMSMPPRVRWAYDFKPDPGSAEARLFSDFLKPRDWCEE